jgi:Lon-like protease
VPRWLIALVVGLFVTAGSAVAAWAVDLPYVGWSPGPISEAIDAVVVDDGIESYPPDGELLVLTVVSQPLNVFELLVAIFDPTVDVYDRAAVRIEGETDEEYRTRQLGLMDAAVQRALTIAFDRLDIDVGEVRYRVESVFGEYPASAFLEPGDFVLAVEGVDMTSIDVVREQLADREPGDVVELTIERSGEVREIESSWARRSTKRRGIRERSSESPSGRSSIRQPTSTPTTSVGPRPG